GEANRRHVGLAGVVRGEGELAHLLGGDVGELTAPVPDVHVPELGEPVDVLAAAHAPDRLVLTADQDDRPGPDVGPRAVEGMNQVLLIQGDQLFDAQIDHRASSWSNAWTALVPRPRDDARP